VNVVKAQFIICSGFEIKMRNKQIIKTSCFEGLVRLAVRDHADDGTVFRSA